MLYNILHYTTLYINSLNNIFNILKTVYIYFLNSKLGILK